MNSPTSWPRTPASPVSIVTCAATRLLPPTRSGSSTGGAGGSSQLAVYNSTSRRSRSHLGVGTSSASPSRPSPKMLPPPTASSSSTTTSSVAAAASASAAAAAALVAAYWYSYSSYNANSANANANSTLLPAMPPYSNVDPRQTTLLMTRRPAPPAVASASRHVVTLFSLLNAWVAFKTKKKDPRYNPLERSVLPDFFKYFNNFQLARQICCKISPPISSNWRLSNQFQNFRLFQNFI